MASNNVPIDMKRLQVIGPISVEAVTRTTTPSWRIMLMGMTGAGKSTFIESFAADKSKCPKIGGDSLEPVTQVIAAYRLVNVVDKKDRNRLVYLVDTPGFGDTKISENQIIRMAQDWLISENLLGVNRILYLAPVTDTRVSGTKGRTLSLFKSMVGENAAEVVAFITTMWDNTHSIRTITQANDRLQQLKEKHWNAYIKKGSKVLKFDNNQKSSLSILDEICNIRVSGVKWFEFEESMRLRKDLKNTGFGKYVYFALLERRGNLVAEIEGLDRDSKDTRLNFLLRGKRVIEKAAYEVVLKLVERDIREYGEVSEAWKREFNLYLGIEPAAKQES